MKKATLFIAAFLMAGAMKAQDSVTLDLQFMPNKKYTQVIGNDTNMEMSYGGEGANMIMKMSFNNLILTDGVKAGSIPLTMQSEMSVSMDMEGMDSSSNEIAMKLAGTVKEGELVPVFTSVESEDMTEDMKGQVFDLVTKMMENISFPKKTLKVGESFVAEIPASVPFGGGAIDMLDKGTYKLVKIEVGKAYFDVRHDISLGADLTEGGFNGKGNGTGKMVYDIASKYPLSLSNDLAMTLNISQEGMSVEIKTNTKQSLTNTISNR